MGSYDVRKAFAYVIRPSSTFRCFEFTAVYTRCFQSHLLFGGGLPCFASVYPFFSSLLHIYFYALFLKFYDSSRGQNRYYFLVGGEFILMHVLVYLIHTHGTRRNQRYLDNFFCKTYGVLLKLFGENRIKYVLSNHIDYE